MSTRGEKSDAGNVPTPRRMAAPTSTTDLTPTPKNECAKCKSEDCKCEEKKDGFFKKLAKFFSFLN